MVEHLAPQFESNTQSTRRVKPTITPPVWVRSGEHGFKQTGDIEAGELHESSLITWHFQ